jgi:8-oxo-dGTP pyrophosphatase MutT (NUDIX family)
MPTDEQRGLGDPLAAALSRYRPHSDDEAADVARARALASTGDPWGRATALHATVSAAIVHPPTGRMLVRWHARERLWLLVGGHADPGESDPLAIAVREAEEESGLGDLAPWPDPDIVHVAVVPVTGTAREPAHEHADLRFVLATGDPDAARPENPLAPLRWLRSDDAELADLDANVRETLARVGRLL